jgi:Skp family chaperone for outer membrane proteins
MDGIMKMKTRTTVFALALCFASSLAMADNPSDAQLVADDAGSAVVQQDERAGCTDQLHNKNQKEASSSEKMARKSSKSESKKAAKTSEAPAKNSASAL